MTMNATQNGSQSVIIGGVYIFDSNVIVLSPSTQQARLTLDGERIFLTLGNRSQSPTTIPIALNTNDSDARSVFEDAMDNPERVFAMWCVDAPFEVELDGGAPAGGVSPTIIGSNAHHNLQLGYIKEECRRAAFILKTTAHDLRLEGNPSGIGPVKETLETEGHATQAA